MMKRIIGNLTQSNGCPVPVTWFAQMFNNAGGSNPKKPRELFLFGLLAEPALHPDVGPSMQC